MPKENDSRTAIVGAKVKTLIKSQNFAKDLYIKSITNTSQW